MTLSVWLLGSALTGCSLLVDNELDGRDFGKKLGFAEGDGGKRAPDGGGDEQSSGERGDAGGNGSGGRGGSEVSDAGDRGGPDDGVGMDSGSSMSGMDSGVASGANNLDSGEGDAADGSNEAAPDSGTSAPLTITSATPAADSSTTANVLEIEIVFSEPVEPVGASDLQVHDGGGGLISGTIGTSGATVTFTPSQPLRSMDGYQVTVGAGVSAKASGVTLGEEQRWTFKIVTGFANDATVIDASSTPGGSMPAVAVDADGNALVVWVQNGAAAGTSTLWYAFYRSGSGWDKASELDSRAGHAGAPSVAMTPNGTAFVAWTQADAGSAYVLARRYDPQSGWEQPHLFDSDPDNTPASLSAGVGVNPAGRAIVAWVRGEDSSSNGTGLLYFATYDSNNKTWDSPQLVTDSNGVMNATGEIQAAISSTGFLAIGAFSNTFATLFVRGNAGWELPFRDYDYTNVKRMAVAADATGAFYAGCHDPEGGGNEVARIAGTSAGAMRNVAVGNNAYSVDPKLSMAADADAVAAFLAVPGGATSVTVQALGYDSNVVDWAANATDVFPNRGGLVPSQPDVTVYGTSALIAWEAGGNLYTVERAPNRSYSAAAMRSHVAANVVADSVQVAAGNSGNGVIVWAESSTPPRIAAQTFRGVR